MANRVPPRFVPTLTEVVRPDAVLPAGPPQAAAPAPAPATPPWAPAPAPAPSPAPALAGLTEEQMVHRVMQRIDLGLERRLREAIAATVLQQTRDLGPLLRDEVEQVVRQVVSQAFAEELNVDPHQRS